MTKELESLQLKVALIEEMAAELIRLREELAKPEQEPVLFIHPSTLEMASAHVGAWKPGHELPGYIALYTSPPQRQPLTDEVHNAFLQGIRYAANKYEVVSDEIFTGGDVSNFLLMGAEELDSSDITRAIETSNGIKEQP